MTAFALLEFEPLVQSGDLIRLDAARSFSSNGAITALEIDPTGGGTFVDVLTDKYLDWVYEFSVDRTVRPVLKVTTASDIEEKRFQISVVTESSDALWSNDEQLKTLEPEIKKRYLPKGKATFNNIHRRAQELILDNLDRRGLVSQDGTRLVKTDFVDNQDVSEWSSYLTLQIIFDGASNAVDDVFDKKARKYEALANSKGSRVTIRLDLDRDGTQDLGEQIEPKVLNVVRR